MLSSFDDEFFYRIGFTVYDTNRLLLSIKLQFLLRGINLKKQYTYCFENISLVIKAATRIWKKNFKSLYTLQ